MQRILAGLLPLLTAAVLAAGCGSSSSSTNTSTGASSSQPGKGKPTLTLGTKNFTEEFILGQLYKQALEAKGYSVSLKSNIGATEVVDKALTSGKIDAYPEYTGETVATVEGKQLVSPSSAATVKDAKTFYAKRGQITSNPTPFQDVDAIGTLKSFAAQHGLKSVGDLKKLSSVTLGARPEFKSRFEGLVGMQKKYGLNNIVFKQLALGLQYTALDKKSIQTADVFTTDAQLASGKYAVLTDPKGIFGFQNVLFVINKSKYAALGGPTFMAIINHVNSLLTSKAMRTMNAAVDVNKQDPAAVASSFLKANGLT
jgi:osmoprotectant transport system substrate-binding protein